MSGPGDFWIDFLSIPSGMTSSTNEVVNKELSLVTFLTFIDFHRNSATREQKMSRVSSYEILKNGLLNV
jgi:hypothetical protein